MVKREIERWEEIGTWTKLLSSARLKAAAVMKPGGNVFEHEVELEDVEPGTQYATPSASAFEMDSGKSVCVVLRIEMRFTERKTDLRIG